MKNLFFPIAWVMFMLFSLSLPGQSLIGYYPFNGNAHDESGNGLHGTLYGSPALTTDLLGNPNSAYQFNGSGDYISVGDSSIFKPVSAVTVSLFAWNANWATYTDAAGLAGNTQSGGYELYLDGGSLEAYARRNGSYGIVSYSISSLAAGWHHFAMTFDGRYTVLYIDGAQVNSGDAGAVYPLQYGTPDNHTLIGAEAGYILTEGDYFTGKIDEVRFYNYALSPTEMAGIYGTVMGIRRNYEHPNEIRVFFDPAADELNIRFSLSVAQRVAIMLHDISGNEMALAVRKSFTAGTHILKFSIAGMASSIYFCTLVADDFTKTIKVAVVR